MGRGMIIQGRRLFLIFPSKGGDYSREVITVFIQLTALGTLDLDESGHLFKVGAY